MGEVRGLWKGPAPGNRNQVAAPGFLLLKKLSVTLLGPTELALRLFLWLAGVAALFLCATARRFRVEARTVASWMRRLDEEGERSLRRRPS